MEAIIAYWVIFNPREKLKKKKFNNLYVSTFMDVNEITKCLLMLFIMLFY